MVETVSQSIDERKKILSGSVMCTGNPFSVKFSHLSSLFVFCMVSMAFSNGESSNTSIFVTGNQRRMPGSWGHNQSFPLSIQTTHKQCHIVLANAWKQRVPPQSLVIWRIFSMYFRKYKIFPQIKMLLLLMEKEWNTEKQSLERFHQREFLSRHAPGLWWKIT